MRLEKTKTVFVLGAGASFDSGCPLMADFLDRAYHLRRYTEREIDLRSFELVFDAINQLQSVFAKSRLELLNIESVFAAFEMAQLFGRLGTLETQQLSDLTDAIRFLIVDTLEWSMKFRRVGSSVRAPESYESFVRRIRELVADGRHDVTVITFNYDLGLDFALWSEKMRFGYGLEGTVEDGSIPLLKLHGSINWARCPQCKDLGIVGFERASIRDDNSGGPVFLRLRAACQGYQACHGISRETAIVPPTWNKTQHYTEISNVWRLAAQKLSQAENIVIMGYSLPPTDEFFRYLFALGTVGSARLQRLMVFDPDPEVDKRYRGLLGPMALQRYKLLTHGDGLFQNAMHTAIREMAN